MGSCFLVIVAGVFVVITLIRWFEQTADAVDSRQWGKLALLVLMPFAAWLFPSRVSAGRPEPVPLHEPVQGFGLAAGPATKATASVPKQKPKRATADADKVAKLREKMRQQGMIEDET